MINSQKAPNTLKDSGFVCMKTREMTSDSPFRMHKHWRTSGLWVNVLDVGESTQKWMQGRGDVHEPEENDLTYWCYRMTMQR